MRRPPCSLSASTAPGRRTGAPVVSFCRIDDRPIRFGEPITHPDAVIVQDPTLLHQVKSPSGAIQMVPEDI